MTPPDQDLGILLVDLAGVCSILTVEHPELARLTVPTMTTKTQFVTARPAIPPATARSDRH
jgi:hypothetical protein